MLKLCGWSKPEAGKLSTSPTCSSGHERGDAGAQMKRFQPEAPLPRAMQGRWVGVAEPTYVVIIRGGEITCADQTLEYDYRYESYRNGNLIVNIEARDTLDASHFENVMNFVLTSDGDLNIYNYSFAELLVRA
jgi:hypothetical protein